MIVEMKTGASREEVDGVVQKAREEGLNVQLNEGTEKTVVALQKLVVISGRPPGPLFFARDTVPVGDPPFAIAVFSRVDRSSFLILRVETVHIRHLKKGDGCDF